MAKKLTQQDGNQPKPDSNDTQKVKKITKNTVVYNLPKKKKKRRSEKIRLAMCVLFSACILCLTMPFTTFNFERALDTDEEVLNLQKEIDNACADILKAKDELVLADEKEVEENKGLEKSEIYYPKTLSKDNVIGQKCETQELLDAIDEAAQIDRTIYTRESYDNLLEKIYVGTGVLTQKTVISDTGFQLIFGNSLSGSSFSKRTEGTFQRLLFSIGFIVVPVLGFFVASLDKKHHFKNIVATVGSALLIFILFAFFPLEYLDYGAVVTFILYTLIFILGIAGFYTKQQEDYWLNHYEECVEKGMTKWLPDGYLEDRKSSEQIKADKKQQALVDSAKNAQKRRSKKK